MRVYVINQRKEPLMPTTPCKARKLLKLGRSANCKDLKLISKAKTLLWERRIDVAVSSHD